MIKINSKPFCQQSVASTCEKAIQMCKAREVEAQDKIDENKKNRGGFIWKVGIHLVF
jgi:hypothetical protein